jgi:hypothetical protein
MTAAPRVDEAEVDEYEEAAAALRDSTCRWLWSHLDWFHPEVWARHLPVREFDAQPALELMLLSRRLGGCDRLTEPALRVAAAVVDRQVFRGYFEDPDHLLRYWLFLLALVHAGGLPRPELVALAGEALRRRFPNLRGMLPVEHQELRYALDLAGLDAPLPSHQELAATAIADLLTRRDNLSTMDAYSLTHVVLYGADLGNRPLPLELGPIREMVREQLEVYIEAGDHDLTAELMHCARIVGIGRDPLVLRAMAGLLAAQHDDGGVPSPPFNLVIQAGLPPDQLAGYRFAARYHTTLVTALATTDHLARG